MTHRWRPALLAGLFIGTAVLPLHAVPPPASDPGITFIGHGAVPGNALGLTYAQFRALDSATLASERTRIETLFQASRPHYLIDTISDLPAVITDINQRLARGEMPQAH